MIDWYKEIPFAITISDLNGDIIYMNDKSIETFSKSGGKELIGKKLNDCHSERSKEIIKSLLDDNRTNTYTIIKNGKKKIIHQTPYYYNGETAGLVEISIILPDEMPNYNRDN